MVDRVYFTDEFNGRRIDFEFPHNSSWTLLEKVKEKHVLADKEDFETMGARPCAWAVFSCQNINEPSRRALMKVYMQIPYTGSEFQRARQRKTQASATPCERVRNEFSALSRLHEAGCQYAPDLIGYRDSDRQDDDDLIPGGYIVYLATTLVPGISLGPGVIGNNQYWHFSADIRESIREAFKVAYLNIRSAGVDVYFSGTHKLVWDGELKKIYIVNFEKSQQAEPRTWRDKFFAMWFLAHPPPGSNWDINTRMVDAGWGI